MITYVATLDVSRALALHVSRLLAARRREIGTPKGRLALTCFGQAVLLLRWFRDNARVACLARDAGIGIATAYRYLHEGIDVLAEQAPDLHEALQECA